MIYRQFDLHEKGSLPGSHLTVYIQEPADKLKIKERPLILICPGGGYSYTSDREAEPIALSFLAKGFHAAILRYSCEGAHYPTALLELARSVLIIRENADDWHVDRDSIVIQGCSAGGHLAASFCCTWRDDLYLKELSPSVSTTAPDAKELPSSNAKELPSPVSTGAPDAKELPSPDSTGAPDARELPSPDSTGAPDARELPSPDSTGAPDAKELPSPNAKDQPSPASTGALKPNGLLLCYPVITSGEHAHRDSFRNLLGDRYDELVDKASLENAVNDGVPRTFIWHTFTDQAVPVENSLLFATALRQHGISTELHIFPEGCHGLALANHLTEGLEGKEIAPCCEPWIDLATTWMKYYLER